jgi:uncharacterized protein YegL
MPATPHASLLATDDDTMLNPATRLPVAVVLDTSGSMHGEPIRELASGVELFLEQVGADPDASASCDLAFVSLGAKVRVLRPFGLARAGGLASCLEAEGPTPMGEGVSLALDLLEHRKALYRSRGVRYFQPWLVLMTDGQPSDDTRRIEQRVSGAVEQRRLTVFPVAIGPSADLARLRAIAGGVDPVRLKGLDFRAFFRWLSASMSATSRSRPGLGVRMPSPFEWIES